MLPFSLCNFAMFVNPFLRPDVQKLLEILIWPFTALAVIGLMAFSAWGKNITAVSIAGVTLNRVKEQVAEHETALQKQQSALLEQQLTLQQQQEQLNELVKYSISDYKYNVLQELSKAKKQGKQGSFFYRQNGGFMMRDLRFLIDHGYIGEIYEELVEGENIVDLIHITPAGERLLQLRGGQ
jgi:hypothetical protein